MITTRLTRYPEGSIRELGTISFPLMISVLASLCMIFTDRLFLARYSIDAMNAVVNAGTLAWALMGGLGMLTAMSEVLVAQYNGAKQFERIGTPVWQMIWVCLFSYVVFIPLALLAPVIFAANSQWALEAEFFRWLMFFGPSYGLMTAFAGFFVGRGKTKLLIMVALIANILNTALDWILIFGIPPYIPEMGVRGAAIATSLGYLSQALILAALFFHKKYRIPYGTNRWQLNVLELKKCCKIGFPQGLFSLLEILGWAIFFWLMTSMSKIHITVSSICQSLLILFSFFNDGLSRGIAAAAGNWIGAKRIDVVYRVLRSALVLQAIFCAAVACIILLEPKALINYLFFQHDLSFAVDSNLLQTLKLCLIFSFLYLFCEGIRWIFSGLLIAAGDTFFLMVAGSLSVWIGLLMPIYLIVVRYNLAVEYAWLIAWIYSTILFTLYAIRFQRGAWKKIDLVSDQSVKEIGIESVSSASPKN